jgi:hypothetical protein
VLGYTACVQDNDFTKIHGWPGYRVFQHEINEGAKTLRLWVRRKCRSRPLIYSGCGERVRDVVDVSEREVRGQRAAADGGAQRSPRRAKLYAPPAERERSDRMRYQPGDESFD